MDQAPSQRLLHDAVDQGTADNRSLAPQPSDAKNGCQILSPAEFIEMMGLDIDSFARDAHVHRSTVIHAPAAQSVQSHISATLQVLQALSAVSARSLQDAIFWYRNATLGLFDCQTAESLVAQGRSVDVLDFLDCLQAGFAG